LVRAGLASLLLVGALGVSAAAAKPGRPGRPRAMNLFAAAGLLLEVNQQQCGITNIGEVCASFAGSPVGGGGFWPKGTPDQYIFNSGLQVVGVVPSTAVFGGPGVSWAGDTLGAYFFDASGDQAAGDGISLVYNRLSPSDVASWPQSAKIRDSSIYNPLLVRQGLSAVSQGDAWVRYWEGDPAFLTGREHPMGILVDERALAWNYPTGNEDIIYFVFTFYNVTADGATVAGRAKYTNATSIPTELRDSIADIGARFQSLNEKKFKIDIADTGYTIQDAYAAFSMDADVAVFSQNYATAILPFNIGLEYTGTFQGGSGWVFPSAIFGPPFASATGFIGVKFLKSPQGLTLFSQTFNPNQGFGLLDPSGVNQLYRYLSGFFGPSDNPCSVGTAAVARQLHLCYLGQVQGDARFYQASGPFQLNPGEARSIVVAYINAAPVNTNGAGGDLPIGGDLQPGTPAPGDTIFARSSAVRPIERIAGWVSQSDINGNGSIDQTEVQTVSRSLLNKALVAQNVFDFGFLLPFAPDAPNFYLVPGNNQVTVVWQQSKTETDGLGDPYFGVASQRTIADPSDPLVQIPNPLYDPDFRQFDVEGYRIYRGRTSSQLELVAQYDYTGTSLVDYTGRFDYGLGCAPELGVQSGCPVIFDTVPTPIVPTSPHVEHELAGDVIQVKGGGRFVLNDGSVLTVRADTAVINAQCGNVKCPPLSNSGVPFAYEDHDVLNSFTYFYAVTAFDVNSFFSTPSSLESPRVTKFVTPRKPSGQEAGGGGVVTLTSPRGQTLTGTMPTIDAATGIFSGPMPPTDGLLAGFPIEVGQLITGATVSMQIDSVTPGAVGVLDFSAGPAAVYYITLQRVAPNPPYQIKVPVSVDCCDIDKSGTAFAPLVAFASNPKTVRFKGSDTSSYALSAGATVTVPGAWRTAHWGRGSVFELPANSDENGPRWWAGTGNENTPNPNSSLCSPARGSCSITDFSKTAGSIAGVTIFHLQSYSTIRSVPGRNLDIINGSVTRAADFHVYWGAGGVIDSVIDVTHDAPVPFSPAVRASWGILTDESFAGVEPDSTLDLDNGKLTWTDVLCVDPYPGFDFRASDGSRACNPPTLATLMDHATLSPIAIRSVADVATSTATTTGNGFVFYLNGHWFLMQMASLPADGTVWSARFYSGAITGTAAAGDYAFVSAVRPPAVPGLQAQGSFTGTTFDSTHTTNAQLAAIHTVPDPYYVANALETTANQKILKFVNLPSRCVIRVYSVSGVLVAVIPVADATGGGEAAWDLRNRNNQFVASGVYFYHVETPDGKSKLGRFTVINFAP